MPGSAISFFLSTAFLLMTSAIDVPAWAEDPFESLGVPVRKAGLMGVIVGPGPTQGTERIYFNFRQDGGKLFLVSVDPVTGESEQFKSPAGTGAWGLIVGPDERIYLGTHEGPDPEDSGRILVFDPKQPKEGIQLVGRPAESETYLWNFTAGADKKIYGCTYPNAKLVSYDPATGAMADLGRMDPEQKYTRSLCTGPDGKIYLGIGYGKANVVAYDPITSEHHAILPEEYRRFPSQTYAGVYKGVDGKVYVSALEAASESATAKAVTLVIQDSRVERAPQPAPAFVPTTLRDGRIVQNPSMDGTYEILSKGGSVEKRTFTYQGDGAGIFMVSTGPLGRIYGGTYMPNELFWYDPATGRLENPGNPSETSGEIYSMLDYQGFLYTCSYPGSFLSKWDPTKPWSYGRAPESNPRGFGRLGPSHLRPRAMILGPDDLLYIGSYPEYGRHGGGLAIWDPKEDKLVENFPNLIANQSIVSLVYDPDSRLIYGGASIEGGGGTNPIEKEARFFAFNPKTRTLEFQDIAVPGMPNIRSLEVVGHRLYGIAGGDNLRIFSVTGSAVLFVYDLLTGSYLHRGDLGIGAVLDCSLRRWTDGRLYGLTAKSVFSLDPVTYKAEVLATYPGEIRCGFALDEQGLYFGDRATLMRYRWKTR
jgi:streptogramin lyase